MIANLPSRADIIEKYNTDHSDQQFELSKYCEQPEGDAAKTTGVSVIFDFTRVTEFHKTW